MPEIDAVILAGGRSRRMGRDKALLPFGGCETLSEYQYRRLHRIFPRVYLSAKEDKFPFRAPLIPDEAEESSPMIALAAILKHIGGEAAFILGVDLPFVDERIIQRLLQSFAGNPEAEAVIPVTPRGPEPLCAIYTRRLFPRIEASLGTGKHRLQSLFETGKILRVPFQDTTPFANLNRPEEYEKAMQRVRSEE
ncbi:MAG TPA: molybdenum cofactor guanylyltransferase [Nitratifractor salsuginis]|uniref:Probable molybdenum cofactor guanylyltransferase n=1 Tax=Nitratifractor salsuginis TaxID=269261 RepID=A0A7V2WLX1_9BACT|nr:molybdenum cofactor guanylyltransferase [Nitratifractor salsuginis]